MRYLDTSSLVALYYPEKKSASTAAHLQSVPMPLAFTALHELEFTNAAQLKLFRREAHPDVLRATLDSLRADIDSGVLQRLPLPWPAVFAAATRVSLTQSRALGSRTLDLLHIAAALALEASEFLTADERQGEAAAKEGLKVVKL